MSRGKSREENIYFIMLLKYLCYNVRQLDFIINGKK